MKGRRLSSGKQRAKYVIVDWLTGSVAFFVFNIVRYCLLYEPTMGYGALWKYMFSGKLIIEQCIVPIGMLGIYWLSGYYNLPFGKSRLQELATTFFSAIINTVIIYLILLINDQTGQRSVNYEIIITLFGLFFLITYLGRLPITSYALKHFKKHSWEFNILIIGSTELARKTAENLVARPSRVGYRLAGFVDIPGETPTTENIRRFPIEDIDEVCKQLGIDQLIIVPESYDEEKVLGLLYRLFPLNLPIKISPDTFSFVTSSIRLKDIYGEPFVDLTTPTLSESSKNVKRFTDVIVSGIILLFFSPFYLIISLCIKLTSKGPVFYSQERIGMKQKPFNIHKFRTMRVDAEKEGPQLSSDTDTRVTSIGRFLRKYRIDEIPQFWNVLKGEMSIVGPRPEREFFIKKIMERAPYYVLVYQVRPGITSWGMVKYGYASTVDQMVERTRYDLIYMANMSLFVDIKILIYTIRTVLTGKGV